MLVRCDNCSSEYSLDDQQVPAEGATVRCAVCAHVFEVRVTESAAKGAPAKAPFRFVAPGARERRAWQIRTQEGMLFEAPDMATIETWVLEGRLLADDEASRSGQVWLRIADLPELRAVFAGNGAGQGMDGDTPAQGANDVESSSRGAEVPPPPNFADMDFLAKVRDDDDEAVSAPRWRRPEDGALAGGGGVPVTGPVGAASLVARLDETLEREADPHEPAAAAPASTAPAAAEHDAMEAPAPVEAAATPRSAVTTERVERARQESPSVESTEILVTPFDDERPASRRGRSMSIAAAAGLVIGVGVVFGHPAIRAQVLSLGSPTAVSSPDVQAPSTADATRAADAAIASGGLTALAKSEAELQRALDRGDLSEPVRTELAVLLADVLATRSLLYSMAAAVDEARAASLRESARDDLTRAAQLVGEVRVVPTRVIDRVGFVRARVRLAQGRSASDILSLLPAAGEDAALTQRLDEISELVAAQGAWSPSPAALASDAAAAIVARARADGSSGLVVGAAIMALRAAGDVAAAETLQASLRARVEDHPLAVVPLSAAPDAGTAPPVEAIAGDTTGDAPALVAGEDAEAPPAAGQRSSETTSARDGAAAAADGGGQGAAGGQSAAADQGAAGGTGAGKGGGSKSSGGAKSFDALLERGCAQVESGSASAGVTTLLQAFDLDPNDVDVNVCLGIGYAKLNNHGRALHFYEKALVTSPKHRAALEGAAAAAVKNGNEGKAKRLNERLLEVDPGHAKAKAYLGVKDTDTSGQGTDGGDAAKQPSKPSEASEGPQGGDAAPPAGGESTGAAGDAKPGSGETSGPSEPKAGAGSPGPAPGPTAPSGGTQAEGASPAERRDERTDQ